MPDVWLGEKPMLNTGSLECGTKTQHWITRSHSYYLHISYKQNEIIYKIVWLVITKRHLSLNRKIILERK
jgi:hypothetical protein